MVANVLLQLLQCPFPPTLVVNKSTGSSTGSPSCSGVWNYTALRARQLTTLLLPPPSDYTSIHVVLACPEAQGKMAGYAPPQISLIITFLLPRTRRRWLASNYSRSLAICDQSAARLVDLARAVQQPAAARPPRRAATAAVARPTALPLRAATAMLRSRPWPWRTTRTSSWVCRHRALRCGGGARTGAQWQGWRGGAPAVRWTRTGVHHTR